MKKRKDYDYYLFVDYSEDLVGYSIIKQEKIQYLLPKISKFTHYKDKKNRKIYLNKIKENIRREKILSFFEKIKIQKVCKNLDLIGEFFDNGTVESQETVSKTTKGKSSSDNFMPPWLFINF
jgi:ribosomal protein L15